MVVDKSLQLGINLSLLGLPSPVHMSYLPEAQLAAVSYPLAVREREAWPA
jgi:hypothetical protein